MIGEGTPCNEFEEGEGDVQEVSMDTKDRLARAHSCEEELQYQRQASRLCAR